MRYRDASHVDVGGFYARSPGAGKIYRIVGHVGAAAAAWCALHGDARGVTIVLGVMILCWLAAWWQIVGTLWRSSMVATLVGCAAWLTASRCGTICCGSL